MLVLLPEEIKRSIEALNQASHAVSKVLYEEVAKERSASAAKGPEKKPPDRPPGAKGGPDEKIIDAEFETK